MRPTRSDFYLTNFVDFFEMDKQIMDDSEDDKNKAALPNIEILLASFKDTESDLLALRIFVHFFYFFYLF